MEDAIFVVAISHADDQWIDSIYIMLCKILISRHLWGVARVLCQQILSLL